MEEPLDFEELRALVALAEHGSILEAAEALSTSRARLRRKLASLEERTGVAMLQRVRGELLPTEAGQAILDGARRLLTEGALLVAHAREVGTEPTGVLRVALQVGYPHHLAYMASMLIRRRFPHLRLHVQVDADPSRLLPETADLAVCIGDDFQLDGCVRFEVARFDQQLVGSQAYFAAHGRPCSVDELAAHRIVVWVPPRGGPRDHLELRDGGKLFVDPVLATNDERSLRDHAHRGEALAYMPVPPFADPDFPGLQVVLGDQVGAPLSVRVYTSRALRNVPRVRAILDALAELLPGGAVSRHRPGSGGAK